VLSRTGGGTGLGIASPPVSIVYCAKKTKVIYSNKHPGMHPAPLPVCAPGSGARWA